MTDKQITEQILEHAKAIYEICQDNGIDYISLGIIDKSIQFNNDYWIEGKRTIVYWENMEENENESLHD